MSNNPRCAAQPGGSQHEYPLRRLRDLWRRMLTWKPSSVCFGSRTDLRVFSALVGERSDWQATPGAIQGVPVALDHGVPVGTARVVTPPDRVEERPPLPMGQASP